jgi:hypothetical protein
LRLSCLGILSVLVAALSLHASTAAAAGSVSFGPSDVRSVFYVAKSENKNQVHYALRLDSACRPLTKKPVFAYWRRHRDSGSVDAPLEGAGVRVYGASDDQKVQVAASGGSVEMYVKALKRVRIQIRIEKTAKGCTATPMVTILKERARLSYAFLQLGRFGLTVKHVDVIGFRERDGKRITERFE